MPPASAASLRPTCTSASPPPPSGKLGCVAKPDDLAEELRRLALSLPETYEDEPWGHPVFKVADNKMFASMSVAPDCVQLTVKLTAKAKRALRRARSVRMTLVVVATDAAGNASAPIRRAVTVRR